jgi:hypothetical protein
MFDGTPTGADRPSKKRNTSWRKGKRLDKTAPAFLAALEQARTPLPPIDEWTFGEVQVFHNAAPKRCETEYVLKLAATTEQDFDLLTAAKRRSFCTERWASLSTVQQFAHNLCPSRSPIHAAERPTVDDLLHQARDYNRDRVAGQPAALMGFVGKRLHGAGTIRNQGCIAVVFWAQVEDGPAWLPIVYVSSITTDGSCPLAPPPAGRDRGEKASAWLYLVYGEAYQKHLVRLRDAAIARDARVRA